jgi:DnaJ like chaperone protein
MKILLLILAVLYVLSPYDVFPDFIAGWGWIDDLIILGSLWWYFFRYRKARYGSSRDFRGRTQSQWESTEGFSDSKRNHDGQETKKDPYSVLGISKGASPEEIRHAYRRLAGTYHPDKVSHMGEEFRDLAERRFKEIQSAYQALMPK